MEAEPVRIMEEIEAMAKEFQDRKPMGPLCVASDVYINNREAIETAVKDGADIRVEPGLPSGGCFEVKEPSHFPLMSPLPPPVLEPDPYEFRARYPAMSELSIPMRIPLIEPFGITRELEALEASLAADQAKRRARNAAKRERRARRAKPKRKKVGKL